MPGWIRISTPAKPIASATRARSVERSPSTSQASGMTSSGAVMVIAADLASGMKTMARKLAALEVNSIAERPSCVSGRRVRSMPRPKRGTKKIIMKTMWPKARAQEICSVL